MLFPVPQSVSICWLTVRSMLGAHLPQLIKEALKGCCCLKEWHKQNSSCSADLLWMATYSNFPQDRFYKRVSLAWVCKWEAFEHLDTQVGKTWTFPPHTHLLDGHPCSWGWQLCPSLPLLCGWIVRSLCWGTAWGSRSRGNNPLARPAVWGLSGTVAGTRWHRGNYPGPQTVLLTMKQLVQAGGI